MECVYICKGYNRRKRELSRAMFSCDGQPSLETQSANAEILKLMAVKNALKTYDKKTGEQILLNITEGEPVEYLNLPMGRQLFYKERRNFLVNVGEYMGY